MQKQRLHRAIGIRSHTYDAVSAYFAASGQSVSLSCGNFSEQGNSEGPGEMSHSLETHQLGTQCTSLIYRLRDRDPQSGDHCSRPTVLSLVTTVHKCPGGATTRMKTYAS